MAARRLVSIWPTAASTDRPSPSDRIVLAASDPGAPMAPSARRSALRPLHEAAAGQRRARNRTRSAASDRMTRAAAIAAADQSARRGTPDSQAARPTSPATSPRVTSTKGQRGQRRASPAASR